VERFLGGWLADSAAPEIGSTESAGLRSVGEESGLKRIPDGTLNNWPVVKALKCLILQGQNQKSNDVPEKCLHHQL
jgi:hypothetical protein